MASSSGASPNGVAAGSTGQPQSQAADARSTTSPRASLHARHSTNDTTRDALSSSNGSNSIVRDSQTSPLRVSNGSIHSAGDDTGSVRSVARESLADAPESPPKPAEWENEWHWMFDVDFGALSICVAYLALTLILLLEDFYMTLNRDGPAKTLDCGSEGHIASVTNWHELLYINAPDEQCGSVYMMGRFPRRAEALLARAQRRDQSGGKGTFGIQFLPDATREYSLGGCYTRGLINHRWPHIQYHFLSEKNFHDGWYEQETFVNEGVIYQVTRVTPGPEKSQDLKTSVQSAIPKTCQFKVGGPVSFGCLCTTEDGSPEGGPHHSEIVENEDTNVLTCNVSMDHVACIAEPPKRCTLHMELFINGVKRPLRNKQHSVNSIRESPGPKVETDLSSIHTVNLEADKECVIVLALTLTSGSTPARSHQRAPTSEDVQIILGVKNSTEHGIHNQSGNIWPSDRQEGDIIARSDLHSIARTSEYLLSVSCCYFRAFNMSDEQSLQVLTSNPISIERRDSIDMTPKPPQVAGGVDGQPDPDPALISLPEEVSDEHTNEATGEPARSSITWNSKATWLESATFVESAFFAPDVSLGTTL